MSDFPETSPEDFKQIHILQHQNLIGNLSDEEAITDGFLTLACSEEDLRKFSIFSIKDGDKMVGYVLTCETEAAHTLPQISHIAKHIDEKETEPCIILAQICIKKDYRSRFHIFTLLTRAISVFAKARKIPNVVTSASLWNSRSKNAFLSKGYEPVSEFTFMDIPFEVLKLSNLC